MTSNDTSSGTIEGLFIGTIGRPWPDKPSTAISKQQVRGAVQIDARGLEGDEQADLKVHGGPEKAIHHYAAEHMQHWRRVFPEHASTFQPGCFGENISTTGLTEEMLCIGDELQLGTARVQVCQGRQPCWKLNAHIGLPEMAAQFQRSGRTGWYYRVLEAGIVKSGDAVTVSRRLHPEWPLSRIIAARFNPRLETDIAATLAQIESLSASWRNAFAKKSDKNYRENTDKRLLNL